MIIDPKSMLNFNTWVKDAKSMGRTETGESVDVWSCAMEIFGDANQCIRNAVESGELVSKWFQGCCEYFACCAWIILDIWHMCAFMQEDVRRCDNVPET